MMVKVLMNHQPIPAANHFCQWESLQKDNDAAEMEKDVAEKNAEHNNGALQCQ